MHASGPLTPGLCLVLMCAHRGLPAFLTRLAQDVILGVMAGLLHRSPVGNNHDLMNRQPSKHCKG